MSHVPIIAASTSIIQVEPAVYEWHVSIIRHRNQANRQVKVNGFAASRKEASAAALDALRVFMDASTEVSSA